MASDVEKRNKRQYKWQTKKRDRINMIFAKGTREKVQEAAKNTGLSMSQWVERAICEKIERENKKNP